MTTETMTCQVCGSKKAWPDGFPNSLYAECWNCAWKAHAREHHPPTWRDRREARRKLRDRLRIELEKERQLEQLPHPDAPPDPGLPEKKGSPPPPPPYKGQTAAVNRPALPTPVDSLPTKPPPSRWDCLNLKDFLTGDGQPNLLGIRQTNLYVMTEQEEKEMWARVSKALDQAEEG